MAASLKMWKARQMVNRTQLLEIIRQTSHLGDIDGNLRLLSAYIYIYIFHVQTNWLPRRHLKANVNIVVKHILLLMDPTLNASNNVS